MNTSAWLGRLNEELPGWHVWYGGSPIGWYAVPAPKRTPIILAVVMPNRIGPYRLPGLLRRDAKQRYGWYDTCDTCNVPARECGHRQPERSVRAGWCDTCNVSAQECGHR